MRGIKALIYETSLLDPEEVHIGIADRDARASDSED